MLDGGIAEHYWGYNHENLGSNPGHAGHHCEYDPLILGATELLVIDCSVT